jgi:hypothetical protein
MSNEIGNPIDIDVKSEREFPAIMKMPPAMTIEKISAKLWKSR